MKVAIVDSGVHPGHPHVGETETGIAFTPAGNESETVDRLGHGTAVAGVIREKAPHAKIHPVKVFDRRLSADIEVILRALQWCRENGMDLVNLSLGTQNEAHRARFVEAIGSDLNVISPAAALPGALAGVIGVTADATCDRESLRFQNGFCFASPYPRPIPGVPIDKNLQGVSFAVANVTGIAARIWNGKSPLIEALREYAAGCTSLR